jgi:hypothetical protein
MKIVEWVDPWPGMNEDGTECNLPVKHTILATDAIRFQRAYHKKMGREPMFDGARLLDEFIISHWADIKEVEPDGCSGD